MNNTAQDIARKINEVVDDFLRCSLSVQECSEQTNTLWEEATRLGLAKEVDDILQAESEAEMAEAIQEMERALEKISQKPV